MDEEEISFKNIKRKLKRFSLLPIASKFPNCQSCGHHQLSHFCLLNKDNADDDKSLKIIVRDLIILMFFFWVAILGRVL